MVGSPSAPPLIGWMPGVSASGRRPAASVAGSASFFLSGMTSSLVETRLQSGQRGGRERPAAGARDVLERAAQRPVAEQLDQRAALLLGLEETLRAGLADDGQ